MSAEAMNYGWYYWKQDAPSDQRWGPFTWEQIFFHAQNGTLAPGDHVWHQQLGDWTPASKIPGLFAAHPTKKRSQWIWIAPLIAVVVIVGAALGAYFGLHDRVEDVVSDAFGEVFIQEEGEILLEPVGSAGPDSFAGEIFVSSAPPSTLASTTSVTTPATTQAPITTIAGEQPVAVASLPGDTPALYGGSKNKRVADKEGQLRFLADNPAKAAAFCEALNSDPALRWEGGDEVRPDRLPAYFEELTPMLLTRDIRVTNHGYRDGHPTPRQSVLQAGQLVLVDRYGVPRVRCECGNPLIPPKAVNKTPRYTGPRWPGFDPTTVIVIQQTTIIIEDFAVIDVNTGEIFVRPPGSDGSQDGSPPSTGTTEAPSTTTTQTSVTTTSEEPGPEGPIPSEELNGFWQGTLTITDLSLSNEAAEAAEAEGCSVAMLQALQDQPLPMTMDITVDAAGTGGAATMVLDVSSLDPEGEIGVTNDPTTMTFTIDGNTLYFEVEDDESQADMVGRVRREGGALVITGAMNSGDPAVFTMAAEWEVRK